MRKLVTVVFFSSCWSSGDGGDAQLLVQALEGSREPVGLQVDGAEGRLCQGGDPFEAGRLRQERVDLTLRLLDGASGGVERGVAEVGRRV